MNLTASHTRVPPLLPGDVTEVTPWRGAAQVGPAPELAYKGLLAFTFVMMLAPQESFPQLQILRPALLSAMVAIGAYTLHRFLRGEPMLVRSRELWIAAALLWWAILTMPLSLWPGGSATLLKDLFVKALLIFWIIAQVVDTPRRLTRLTWWLTLLGVPLAFTAVKKYFSGEFIQNVAGTRIQGYEAALTANPNDLALMLNLLLPLGIALFLHAPTLARRAMLLGIVGLTVAGIVLTFSRSGFVTLVAILALYAYRFSREGRLSYIGALIVTMALAAPLLPPAYVDRLATIVDKEEDPTGSAQHRWADMEAAAGYVWEHPVVGAGLGQDILALNAVRGATWTAVHDVYLQYAVDLGLPGLFLFLLLLGSAVGSATSARRQAEARGREDIASIAHAISVSLLAFGVAAIFYPAGYHFYFYYFAGLAVAVRQITRRTLLPRPVIRRDEVWSASA